MQKVMLVTGASSGIGAAVARRAARAGYAVCINYHTNEAGAEELRTSLLDSGTRVITVRADIGTEAGVLELFRELDSQLGTITHLVNNAGVIAPMQGFENTSYQRLQTLFSINVFASFLCAREAVKRMSTRNGGGGGVIVNLSSAAAKLGSPNEFIDYAATKGAIDTFTLGLAKEVASCGIRVNAVRPGLIETPMHAQAGDAQRPEKLKQNIPMQRAGSADEVAASIMWLLSDESSYVTGTCLDVSGGR